MRIIIFRDLMEELLVYIREAVDRKQENVRRRRRRDALRLQLIRVLELIAEHGTFGYSSGVLDRDTQSLHPTFVEYMDGARLYLESEPDKNTNSVKEIIMHFCNFIRKMIKSFSRKWISVVWFCCEQNRWCFVIFSGNLSDSAEKGFEENLVYSVFYVVWKIRCACEAIDQCCGRRFF